MISAILFSLAMAFAATPAPPPEQVDETLWLAREATALMNRSPSLAAEKLPSILREDWNVFVTCGAGRVMGPNAPRCLTGLKSFARLFYRGQLAKLTPEWAEVVHFDINEESRPRVSTTETFVRIHLPYHLPAADALPLIRRVIESSGVRERVQLLADYRRELAEFEKRGIVKVDFDPRTEIGARRRMLVTLADLYREDAGLLDRPAEDLLIGRKFLTVRERNLRLREEVPVTATAEELRRFFTESTRNARGIQLVQARTDELRERIKAVGEALNQKTQADFDCSDRGTLTLEGCLQTLTRLDAYVARARGLKTTAKLILIAGRDEMDEDFATFTVEQRKIWAVRVHFNALQLAPFLYDQNWTSGR